MSYPDQSGFDKALAVIIVSYNTCHMLRACLRSVFAGLERTAINGEVWVVDNASSDGSPDMVRAEFPQAELLALTQNQGFAGANNAALRELGFPAGSGRRPDSVLFLNPDTEVRGDAIAHMANALHGIPNVGVVGAGLVYADGRFQHSAFHFPTLWQVWFDFFPRPARLLESSLNGRYPRVLYQAGQPFPIDHPLGAAMMVRAEVIQQVGLMDEGFFMYAEEVDWCMRVKRAGWEIYCVPTGQITHHAGGSTRRFRDEMFVALWRSRFRLFTKHYGAFFNLAARWLVRLGLRAEMGRARGSLNGEELERRLTAYHRVWKLTKGNE